MKRRISKDEAALCEKLGHTVQYYVEVPHINDAQVTRRRVNGTVSRDAELALTTRQRVLRTGSDMARAYGVCRQALKDDLKETATRHYLINKISKVVGIEEKPANAILSDLLHKKRLLRVAD